MMSPQDLVNGMFELVGGMFTWRSVYVLIKDKKVRGFSITTVAVFSAWGAWNLYYYPFLDQWLSFFGAINIFTANTVWVFLAVKTKLIERNSK